MSPVEGVKNNDLIAYQSVVNKIFILGNGNYPERQPLVLSTNIVRVKNKRDLKGTGT